MMRTVGAALAAFCLAACATEKETPAMWGTLDGKPPLVIAHRGASGHLPEHTLEAYALAIDQGADIVEPDLVFTKDGVLVARHDRYLSTTTDVADHPEVAARRRANDDPNDAENRDRIDWWIEDFTLAELKTLRARQPFPGRSKEFDGLYEIPTFDEMLALVAKKAKDAGRPVGVYPETKHPAFFASIGHDFEMPLLAALNGFDAGPVCIQSFEPEILRRLKGKTDAKLVQLVYEASPGAGPNIPLAEIAKYADGVGASKNLLINVNGDKTDFLDDAHSNSLAVHVWTIRDDRLNDRIRGPFLLPLRPGPDSGFVVDERTKRDCDRSASLTAPAHLEHFSFMSFGVDGVFTDFPETAVSVRKAIVLLRQE